MVNCSIAALVWISSALPLQGHAISLEGGRPYANHVQNKSSTSASTLIVSHVNRTKGQMRPRNLSFAGLLSLKFMSDHASHQSVADSDSSPGELLCSSGFGHLITHLAFPPAVHLDSAYQEYWLASDVQPTQGTMPLGPQVQVCDQDHIKCPLQLTNACASQSMTPVTPHAMLSP